MGFAMYVANMPTPTPAPVKIGMVKSSATYCDLFLDDLKTRNVAAARDAFEFQKRSRLFSRAPVSVRPL
jgi:hypothetical protein